MIRLFTFIKTFTIFFILMLRLYSFKNVCFDYSICLCLANLKQKAVKTVSWSPGDIFPGTLKMVAHMIGKAYFLGFVSPVVLVSTSPLEIFQSLIGLFCTHALGLFCRVWEFSYTCYKVRHTQLVLVAVKELFCKICLKIM